MAAKVLGTTGVLYNDRRRFYLAENEFAELYTSETPFLSGLMNMGSESVDDPDFKMFEYRAGWVEPKFLANGSSNGNYAPGGDTISVATDGYAGVSAGDSIIGAVVDIYSNVSNYQTYKGTAVVTAYDSGTTNVTMKPLGKADSDVQKVSNIAPDDVFLVQTTAAGEGVTSPEAASDELEIVWNSTQIFRTPLELTGTLAAANLRGERERSRLRVNKGREHMMKLERAIFYGYRTGGIGGTANGAGSASDTTFVSHTTDANGKTIRTTMGVVPALLRYGRSSGDQQNLFSVNSSSYSYSNFVDDMNKIAQYNPSGGEFVAYCGDEMYGFWSKLLAGEGSLGFSAAQINVETRQTEFGLHVMRLFAPSGFVLNLVRAPVLRGPNKKRMVVVNPDNVKLVSYRNDAGERGENVSGSYSAIAYRTNIKTDDGYDGIKDEYFSDCGVGIQLVDSHSLWSLTT